MRAMHSRQYFIKGIGKRNWRIQVHSVQILENERWARPEAGDKNYLYHTGALGILLQAQLEAI